MKASLLKYLETVSLFGVSKDNEKRRVQWSAGTNSVQTLEVLCKIYDEAAISVSECSGPVGAELFESSGH